MCRNIFSLVPIQVSGKIYEENILKLLLKKDVLILLLLFFALENGM